MACRVPSTRPTVTLFATRRLPQPYLRYLERSLRERFNLGPTPIDLRVRVRGRHGEQRARRGGDDSGVRGQPREGRAKLAQQHKLFVRDRLSLLLDEGSFVEVEPACQRPCFGSAG